MFLLCVVDASHLQCVWYVIWRE